MRNGRLWRGLLGVDKRTVIEGIEFECEEEADGAELVVARVRPRSAVWGAVAAAAAGRPGMTGVRVGAGGGAWIGARAGGAGGRCAAGVLPRARADRGGGAVGAPSRRAHVCV